MKTWILTRKPFVRKKPVEMHDKPLSSVVQLWSLFSKRKEQTKGPMNQIRQLPATDQASCESR